MALSRHVGAQETCPPAGTKRNSGRLSITLAMSQGTGNPINHRTLSGNPSDRTSAQTFKLESTGASSFTLLTALQEFETRLWCAARQKRISRRNPTRLAGAPLVTQKINIEVSRRRFRMVLANRAIALGWALKGSCKPCAHRLFTTARWLVPEAQRYLVRRSGPHNRNWRIFELAVDLGTLLSRMQPLRVAAGFLIVLVLLVSLDLAMRATAISTQPLAETSAFQHESQIPLVSKQSELVPLPTRKPEGVFKVPNGQGAKANAATQKRIAQQKRPRPKPMR
jgi:hypothetical protein